MTLVALLVLGSMGAALAEESVDPDEPALAPDPGSETFEIEFLEGLEDFVTFVFYWGFEEDDVPECEAAEPTGGGIFGLPVDPGTTDPVENCHVLDVAGPNGQVNHGTMVSAFVHALKDGSLDLEGYDDLPKGQMVKGLAHLDFGKGFNDHEPDGDELADGDDGDGPPDHVVAKKAEKVKGPKK
jgi:hypothetical protein